MRSLIYILLSFPLPLIAQTGINWNDPIIVSDEMTGYSHPRIVLDGNENAVVIWGDDEDVHISRQEGMYFSAAQMLDPMGMSIFTASWAGPDIASKGDTIYVVFKENPEDSEPIYCITSFDGGITFFDPVIVDGMLGDDVSRFPSVAVDEDGNPIIAFMKLNADFLDAQYVVATSNDFGNSFNMDVLTSGFSGGEVCDCCPAGITAKDNYVVSLYRDNLDNLRNTWAGISDNNGISFENGIQIDQTDWTVFACPASGPDGVIIGDNLYSVFMSAGEGDSRIFLSTTSLTDLTDEPDQRISPEIEGLSIQNYPRIASYGKAVAIVWKQVANANSTIPISFTNDINIGFPPDYDTIAHLDLYGLENADVAVSSNKVHVVWQDNYSNAVFYREGVYQDPVQTSDIIKKNNFQIFPNPAVNQIAVKSADDLTHIAIYNVQNICVKNMSTDGKNLITINLNDLNRGIYFIEITNIFGESLIKKIVLQ